MNPPTQSHLRILDLRHGRLVAAALAAPHEFNPEIEAVVTLSMQSRAWLGLSFAPFEIIVSSSVDRRACCSFRIRSADTIRSRVAKFAPLYSGEVCVEIGSAVVAWRSILNHYLSAGAEAPAGYRFASIGRMPKPPFSVGNAACDADHLMPTEARQLALLARLLSLCIAKQLIAAEAEKRAAGIPPPQVDFADSPELDEMLNE